jgi:hypothetical protein
MKMLRQRKVSPLHIPAAATGNRAAEIPAEEARRLTSPKFLDSQ